MADDLTTGPIAGEGISNPDTDIGGVSDDGLQSAADGQSGDGAGTGTTGDGTQNQAEDILYNPDEFKTLHQSLIDGGNQDLANQVEAFQKSLQGAFTQKTQALAGERAKVDAYDAWDKDPIGQLQTMADRMGYTVAPRNGQATGKWTPESGAEPQNWQEVIDYAEQKLMQKLAPALQEVGTMRKASIESQLAEIDPSWQTYEPRMLEKLKAHPTLAQDPAMLYRMSVPADVLESRATQAAIRKLEAKTKSSNVSGPSITNKTQSTGLPDKALSFSEAVEAAKAKLGSQGILPG